MDHTLFMRSILVLGHHEPLWPLQLTYRVSLSMGRIPWAGDARSARLIFYLKVQVVFQSCKLFKARQCRVEDTEYSCPGCFTNFRRVELSTGMCQSSLRLAALWVLWSRSVCKKHEPSILVTSTSCTSTGICLSCVSCKTSDTCCSTIKKVRHLTTNNRKVTSSCVRDSSLPSSFSSSFPGCRFVEIPNNVLHNLLSVLAWWVVLHI